MRTISPRNHHSATYPVEHRPPPKIPSRRIGVRLALIDETISRCRGKLRRRSHCAEFYRYRTSRPGNQNRSFTCSGAETALKVDRDRMCRGKLTKRSSDVL